VAQPDLTYSRYLHAIYTAQHQGETADVSAAAHSVCKSRDQK
jgi:hypothetical protein